MNAENIEPASLTAFHHSGTTTVSKDCLLEVSPRPKVEENSGPVTGTGSVFTDRIQSVVAGVERPAGSSKSIIIE